MKTNIKSRCEFRVRKKAPKNGSKSGFGSVLGPIWGGFGTVLGLFWELLGASGPFFWCLEATFDKALVHDGLQEAFELDFGASGPQFWSPRASILEPLGFDFQASRRCLLLVALAFSCFLLLSLACSCLLLLALALSCFFLLFLDFSCSRLIYKDSSCAFRSIATQVLPLCWLIFSHFFALVANFCDFWTHLKLSCNLFDSVELKFIT